MISGSRPFGSGSTTGSETGTGSGAGAGAPLIFETMVFDNSPEGLAETQETLDRGFGGKAVLGPDRFSNRYATEEDARKGHAQAVAAVEAELIE